jgi:hypothetical protein
MSDFFTRITRHGVSGDRDPREDRLTEILAAVLESSHCRGLARHIVLLLLRQAGRTEDRRESALVATRLAKALEDETSKWTCRVITQAHIVVGDEVRRPDLQLVFEDVGNSSSAINIWLEIKHGTAPHDRQLWSYLEAQRLQGISAGIVLLVAPRASYPSFPAEEIPDAVPELTWQQVAASLSGFRAPDTVGEFLVEALRYYLKGEGLMDPERVTPLHQVSLMNYREALLAVDAVCDLTAQLMTELWSPTEPPHEWSKSDGGTVYEKDWSYPSHRPDEPPIALPTPWQEWGLVWGRFMDSGRLLVDGRPGVPVFYAGVGTEHQGSLAQLDQNKHDLLRRRGFRLIDRRTAETRNEFIWCIGYPEDVLAGPNLGTQAQSLAEWAITAFGEVRAVLTDARR